jgi:hypothetical protein
MSQHTAASRLMAVATFGALSMGLVACAEQPAELNPGQGAQNVSSVPAEFSLTGAPGFLLPPHARTDNPMAPAKLPNGSYGVYGQINEDASYGLYSYFSDDYRYVSVSIWGTDGSSVSQSMDIAADGSQWVQTGSYEVLPESRYQGSYTTTQLNASGLATVYLTDFESGPDSSSYNSIVDKGNTAISPDSEYLSQWSPAGSYMLQIDHRLDGSFLQCESEYTYGNASANSVIEYRSTTACNDSALGDDEDYRAVSLSTWDPVTYVYTSSTTVICLGLDGQDHTLVYDANTGWQDQGGGNAINSPRDVCQVAGPGTYY